MEHMIHDSLQNRDFVEQFYNKMISQGNFQIILDTLKEEDKGLFVASGKFSELTKLAKDIFEKLQEKSAQNKRESGVENDEIQAIDHHKPIPRDIKE